MVLVLLKNLWFPSEVYEKGEWHVHTNYTDGKHTVFEYCEAALELKIPLIAFTEHINLKPSYDVEQFLLDVKTARLNYSPLLILKGFEAKIFPSGQLAIQHEHLQQADYLVGVFHKFPRDLELYKKTVWKLLSNRYVDTWGHPAYFLKHKKFDDLSDDILRGYFNYMQMFNIKLERNSRYPLPPERWLSLAKEIGVTIVNGNDIHSVDELIFNHLSDGLSV